MIDNTDCELQIFSIFPYDNKLMLANVKSIFSEVIKDTTLLSYIDWFAYRYVHGCKIKLLFYNLNENVQNCLRHCNREKKGRFQIVS